MTATEQYLSLSDIQVNHERPDPLFQQLREALRYRILTGLLRPGDRLPPVREAAMMWGLHHHTVRRAYGVLAEEGLVESRPGLGTRVLSPRPPGSAFRNHVRKFLEEVRQLYGAEAGDVVRLVQAGEREPTETPRPLWVVECSHTLSDNLAAWVRRRWGVDARGFRLDLLDTLPEGPVLGTHFHGQELGKRLAARMSEEQLEFVSVQPDPGGIAGMMTTSSGGIRGIVLCEHDAVCGRNVAQDLRRNSGLEVRVVAARRPASVLGRVAEDEIIVFAPGSWEKLTAEQRSHARVHCLPVRINPAEEPVVEAFIARHRIAPDPDSRRAVHSGASGSGRDRGQRFGQAQLRRGIDDVSENGHVGAADHE